MFLMKNFELDNTLKCFKISKALKGCFRDLTTAIIPFR